MIDNIDGIIMVIKTIEKYNAKKLYLNEAVN